MILPWPQEKQFNYMLSKKTAFEENGKFMLGEVFYSVIFGNQNKIF